MNAFLSTEDSTATVPRRSKYFRILAVGCLDIVITLPIGILLLVVRIAQSSPFPFYQGWSYVHSPWGAVSVPAAAWRSDFWSHFSVVYGEWQYPVFAVAVFAVFGLTGEARVMYRRAFCAAAGMCGVKVGAHEQAAPMSVIAFQSLAPG